MEPALNTIHQIDCIKGLQSLRPGSVDLAFADPPFNIGYDYDVYDDKQEKDHYLDWTRKWIGAVCQALKPTGTFWLAIGDEYAAELKMIACNDLGLTCRSWIIWYYTFGVNCTKKFSRSHAHLFHFVKDRKQYTFNAKEIKVPSARQTVYADTRAKEGGRLPDDTWILRPQDLPEGFLANEDTWYFPRVAGTFKERAGFHGCQMPEQLLGRIIRSCSNPGDLVLDPFAGSGTTLVVANKLGRRWIGFDVSESYAKKATERIGKTFEGQALEGAPEPVVSAPRTPSDRDSSPAARPKPSLFVHAQWENKAQRADLERGIVAAFLATSCGFSTDRVVADPAINAAFVDQCHALGIPGAPVTWNRSLMTLRKAAKLASLPRARRTTFPPAELDLYIFASEIAIRRMLDGGSPSLDDILCDPKQAQAFDQIAGSFAPGLSALQYRWAALQIRKRAHDRREDLSSLSPDILHRKLPRFQQLSDVDPDRVNSRPGVYLLRTDPHRHLYAGSTSDLAARLRHKLAAMTPWREISQEIEICMIPFAGDDKRLWLGFQSNLIKQREPDLNYLALGVA